MRLGTQEALFLLPIIPIVFGLICKAISNSRGMKGGFWWGFFLNIIGIVVVAVRPNENPNNSKDIVEDDNYNREEDYNKKPVVLFCKNCNRVYLSYKEKCDSCNMPLLKTTFLCKEWTGYLKKDQDRYVDGFSRGQYVVKRKDGSSDSVVSNVNKSQEINIPAQGMGEAEIIKYIKDYKDLLDSGIISKDEFEKKKKQLLEGRKNN